jgi:hypothetical protein
LEYLVVVVPGFGGSVLERDGVEVWGGLGSGVRRVVDPGVLGLPAGGREPSGEFDDGVRAVGVIDDWRLCGFTVVDGYPDLVRTVANVFTGAGRIDWGRPGGRDLGAGIVVFPYDFRRSVVHAAERLDREVHDRLCRLFGSRPADQQDRVIIVAHSMGGLVARYWAGPGGGADRILGVVTLGTPHRGAPKALDVLEWGLRVGPVPVPGGMSAVMRTWPSLFELLPRYPMVRLPGPGGGEGAHPKDVFTGSWRRPAVDAFGVHGRIERAWESLGLHAPAVRPVYGRGARTLQWAELSGGRFSVDDGEPVWLGAVGQSGDGTVPEVSAVPIELDNPRHGPSRVPLVGVKHLGLVRWQGLRRVLLELIGEYHGDVRGSDERTVVTDLEGVWPTGHPLTIGARVYDRCGSKASAPLVDVETVTRVSARHVPDGAAAGRGEWIEARPVGHGWVATLPEVPVPGVVRVEIDVQVDDGDAPARRLETIRVVDPEGLEVGE